MCAYRRCGAVLPAISGRGNRPKFCQDGKAWGTRDLSCRDAEVAMSDADSLRDDTVAVDETAISALGDQIDRTLAPTTLLLDMLGELRGQLATTVADALTGRANAIGEAEADRKARGLADAAAESAVAKAVEAEAAVRDAGQARTAAERDRDVEHRSRVDAEQGRLRAEGRATALADELARTVQRADAVVERIGDLDRTLAAITTELATERTGRAEQHARAEVALAEVEAAEHRNAQRVGELNATHRAEMEALRDNTSRHLDELRADAGKARTQAEETIRGLQTTINSLSRDIGAAEQTRAQALADADLARTRLAELTAAAADDEPESASEQEPT